MNDDRTAGTDEVDELDEDSGDAAPEPSSGGGVLGGIRRHPWRTALGAVAIVVVVGGVLFRDVVRVALLPDERITATLPLVPALDPAPGETVFRIDAAASRATVVVAERLAGREQDVELTTRAIAGDLAVPDGDASAARLGTIAVDVQQLTSDNNLRDKIIRHEALNSHDHPIATLTDARVVDIEPGADAATEQQFAIEGTLEVSAVARPVRWDTTATVAGGVLEATATTVVKLSDFGVGPITKAGLVSTGNEATITLKIVARDGAGFTPPTRLDVDEVEASDTTTAAVSFASQVQPILEANCASCHQPGEAGASMWTLATAGDAAEVADGLAVVTGAGYMPPWPPSQVGIPLRHARGLTAAQIDVLRQWADSRGALDVPADTPVRPTPEPEVPQPRADVRLELAEPYQGSPAKRDDYRCFILDPGLTEPRFMTGYTFEPDQRSVVHHALVYRIRAARVESARARDEADPGSGFACLAGAGMGTGGGDLVAGWVPGQRPAAFDPGLGFDFQPGDVLVAQIHYHYESANPPDRSRMTLQLAAPGEQVTALRTRELLAPVELPCPPGVLAPLCDREAALADAEIRFGPTGRIIPDVLHRICRSDVATVAARSDGYTAATTCDYQLRESGTIVDVLGHMHELGLAYRMTLNPGTDREKILLDIPTWDFDWQLNYQPVEEVRIESGDVLRVDCSWDRRLRYEEAPRYIFFAEGTDDEMCFSTVTTKPDPPA
jgi:polyisoprenoid-binding protein YceI